MKIKLINDDCLKAMKDIPDNSIDMVLTDPPYGYTQNKWDNIIPFESMWKNLNRIVKENACIALFSDGLFSAKLQLSNVKQWRYSLIWDKVLTSGFLNARKMPLRKHEIIHIFYNKLPYYNPQKFKGKKNHSKGKMKKQSKNNNYSLRCKYIQ